MNSTGYFHETAFYGSDEEFLALVLPFLRGGVEAHEPTVVTSTERNSALIRSALGNTRGVTFIPNVVQYASPAGAIRSYRSMFAEYVTRGARQVRVVGDIPRRGSGGSWHSWARYEAAVNHALKDFPLWGLCPYDTRTTPPDVLADVARTHPYVATADGEHQDNEHYDDPEDFLAGKLITPAPREGTPPTLCMYDPPARLARRAVQQLAAGTALHPDRVADLVIATSEAVNNAIQYGKPPVRLAVWCRGDRIVVAVTDQGVGVGDPYAGLVPAVSSTSGGFGLWMAHQLCSDVTFHRDSDGFTVRLVAEAAPVREGPGGGAPAGVT